MADAASQPPPFAASAADRIDSVGEVALIQHIRNWLGAASAPYPEGIGDDCAVWSSPPPGHQLFFTTDAVVLGRHFEADCPPELAAAKLLKRNLSDIAAMGGQPYSALLALTLAPGQSFAWLERFFHGLRECALEFRTPVNGGDITAGAEGFFAAHITLIGHGQRPLLRQGGQAGDHIFVTGALGGSILGHHLRFRPRLEQGQWLAAQPDVRSLIDISDGLAKDLPELLPTGTIALLDTAAIPLSAAALSLAKADIQSRGNASQLPTSGSPAPTSPQDQPDPAQLAEFALRHALSDGEDHELLFTVAASTDPQAFISRWKERFGADTQEAAANASTTATSGYPPLRLARIGTIEQAAAAHTEYCSSAAAQQQPPATAKPAAATGAGKLYDNRTGKPLLHLTQGGFQHLAAHQSK